MALASQSFSSIQRFTARVHLACRTIFSGLMYEGIRPKAAISSSFPSTSGASSASALAAKMDFRQINRHHRQTGRLKQLLAEAHGLECASPGPDRADPRALQAAHDPANPHEPVQVGGELGAVDVAGMSRRIGPRHAILIEIVGDRDLAAESVPATLDVDLSRAR